MMREKQGNFRGHGGAQARSGRMNVKQLLSALLALCMLLTMVPNMALSARAEDGVSYLDETGTEKTCSDYTVLSDQTTLPAGWYVVKSDTTISSRITVSGDVHLILMDGCTLTAEKGMTVSSLTIYAQSTGDSMGKLIATGTSGASGIGSTGNLNAGTVTINGGNITATGSDKGAGIGGGISGGAGGAVTINGGIVTATGGSLAAGIGGGSDGTGGTVTITGGTVTATGGEQKTGLNRGAGAGIGGGASGTGGTVTITGGTVIATAGGSSANAIGGGSGSTENGTLTIAPALLIQAGSSSSNAAEIAGTPFLTDTDVTSDVAGKAYVKVEPAGSIKYLDANGEEKEQTTYSGISSATTSLSDGNWYVVSGNITVNDRMTVSGEVNLILKDDCTLTAASGMTVTESAALIIYAQSAGTGALSATATTTDYAGIGGEKAGAGSIIINGGTITATGGTSGAGIGGGHGGDGGKITIHRGTVTATGGTNGAGLGGAGIGEGGSITITGGTVTATGSGNAAGIGGGNSGYGGTIAISGGKITATGANSGAGIGGGQNGAGGTVKITGGTVTANAGSSCSNAIGSGQDKSSFPGTLTVSGNLYVLAGESLISAKILNSTAYTTETVITSDAAGKKYVRIGSGQDIADAISSALALTMDGVQNGTYDEQSASRYVASMTEAVANYKDTITCVGWAYQTGSASFTELTSYSVLKLQTVTTSEALLTQITTTYATDTDAYAAFTAIVTDTSQYYALVPYVAINVGGQDYYFTDTGRCYKVGESSAAQVTLSDASGIANKLTVS